MPIQIVQGVCDCAGFPHVAVFHKSGGTPLDYFNIMTFEANNFMSLWRSLGKSVFHVKQNCKLKKLLLSYLLNMDFLTAVFLLIRNLRD